MKARPLGVSLDAVRVRAPYLSESPVPKSRHQKICDCAEFRLHQSTDRQFSREGANEPRQCLLKAFPEIVSRFIAEGNYCF
jgi:hypothetical protein